MNKKLFRRLASSLFVVMILLFTGVGYLKHASSERAQRIESLSRDVQSLRIGASTYQQARAIAERFGTAKFENDWGIRDCSDGYFEKCAYQISIKSPVMSKLGRTLPFVSRLGLHPWSGYAHISIDDGKVAEYSFSAIFKSTDGQWRGFGAEEYESLPKRAVQASISGSYLVSRNDIIMTDERNGLGYSLDSSLTPVSSQEERRRAWHFEMRCLAGNGCNEICDVMPEAWTDFYIKRGYLDVQKYGERYQFCTHSATRP